MARDDHSDNVEPMRLASAEPRYRGSLQATQEAGVSVECQFSILSTPSDAELNAIELLLGAELGAFTK